MSKKNPKPAPTPAADAQARIAQQLFDESSPIRRELGADSLAFLQGDRDVTQGAGFAGLKDIIESQFGRARESVIGSTPTGGGLTSALTDLEGNRASSLVRGTAALNESELNRALTLGTGLVPSAIGGLGSAGFVQGQSALAAQQAGSQKAGSTGRAAGAVLASIITKNPAPAAGAAGGK